MKDHDITKIAPVRVLGNATSSGLGEAANANFAPRKRPEVITRKTFEDAAKSIAVRHNGSLCILA